MEEKWFQRIAQYVFRLSFSETRYVRSNSNPYRSLSWQRFPSWIWQKTSKAKVSPNDILTRLHESRHELFYALSWACKSWYARCSSRPPWRLLFLHYQLENGKASIFRKTRCLKPRKMVTDFGRNAALTNWRVEWDNHPNSRKRILLECVW